MKDQLIAALHAEVDLRHDDCNALDEQQRTEAIDKADDAILATQRQLSELIWRDELHHLWPERIDPRAALGVEGPAPKV